MHLMMDKTAPKTAGSPSKGGSRCATQSGHYNKRTHRLVQIAVQMPRKSQLHPHSRNHELVNSASPGKSERLESMRMDCKGEMHGEQESPQSEGPKLEFIWMDLS